MRQGRLMMLVGVWCAAWSVSGAMAAGVALDPGTDRAGGPVTPEEVGGVLRRNALIDLGMRASPLPEDYEIAADALWIASGLRPRDADTARVLVAAAWAAGDRDLMLEATKTVIRNDPADTVAQLRLISANITARQTVEERMEAYERFLGPAGRSLDPSIRSRLALDAALLQREAGDVAGFEKRLRAAVDLDPTNKDAVSLAARTFTTDTAGVDVVASWQIRLLYADPLDPHVHLTIARIAANQGAINSADRFLTNAEQLFRIGMGDVPSSMREPQLSLQWQLRGAQSVIDTLNPPLYDRRSEAVMAIQARREAGEPISDIMKPEEIRYEIGIDRVRLLAAVAAGDEETRDQALLDLAGSSAQVLQTLAKAAGEPGANQQELFNETVRVFSEFQIMRAIAGRDVDQIGPETELFFNKEIAESRAMRHLRAWAAYGKGDYDWAIELMGTPRPGTNDFLLLALASEAIGDTDSAVPIYLVYARQRSLEAFGALARSRLAKLGKDAEVITPAGVQLRSALGRVPGWMDRMTTDPRTFMMLQAEAVSSTVGPLDRARVRVRLRNSASVPLGLGSSRPIGSRILIGPRPISRLADFDGSPTPKVLEMDQRLRLNPREEIEVVVDADSPYTEWLREVNAQISLRDRYRVIQSFQPSPRGGLVNAPLALVTESGIVQRVMLELARAPVDEIIARVSSDDPADLRAALIATVSRTIEPADDLAIKPADRSRLAAAWSARFTDASVHERALMVLALPHAGQVPEMGGFDDVVLQSVVADGLARAKSDPGLLVATMLTRVRTPDSPVLEMALQSDEPSIRRMGQRLADRLAAGRPSFATAKPGVAGLASPSNSAPMSLGP